MSTMTRDEVIAAITHAARAVVHAKGSRASVKTLDMALQAADAEGYGDAARSVAAAIVEELADVPAASGSANLRQRLLDAVEKVASIGYGEKGYKTAVAGAEALLRQYAAGRDTDGLGVNYGGGLAYFKGRLAEIEQKWAYDAVEKANAASFAAIRKAIQTSPKTVDPMDFAVGDYGVGTWAYETNRPPTVFVVDKVTHGGTRIMARALVAGTTRRGKGATAKTVAFDVGDTVQLFPGNTGGYMGQGSHYFKVSASLAADAVAMLDKLEAAKLKNPRRR